MHVHMSNRIQGLPTTMPHKTECVQVSGECTVIDTVNISFLKGIHAKGNQMKDSLTCRGPGPAHFSAVLGGTPHMPSPCTGMLCPARLLAAPAGATLTSQGTVPGRPARTTRHNQFACPHRLGI